ncbi:MAG: hypothetical protein ACLS89_04910 [Collinsella sp.]
MDGRGPSVDDHFLGGSYKEPRQITIDIDPSRFYPNHDGIDFYHHYGRTSRCSPRWASICSACPSPQPYLPQRRRR